MIRPVPYPKFQHYVAYYIVPVAESKCDTGFQPVISKITGKMPMSLWKNLQQLPFRNRYYVVPVAERSHPNILCSIFRRGGTRLPPFPGRCRMFVGGQYRLADPCSGIDGFRNRYYVVHYVVLRRSRLIFQGFTCRVRNEAILRFPFRLTASVMLAVKHWMVNSRRFYSDDVVASHNYCEIALGKMELFCSLVDRTLQCDCSAVLAVKTCIPSLPLGGYTSSIDRYSAILRLGPFRNAQG